MIAEAIFLNFRKPAAPGIILPILRPASSGKPPSNGLDLPFLSRRPISDAIRQNVGNRPAISSISPDPGDEPSTSLVSAILGNSFLIREMMSDGRRLFPSESAIAQLSL
jgi:hypothetical protein